MSKHATIAELATVVEVDPVLTLALLRFANSALDAPVQPVVRASDAIVRLGLEDTRRVILGIVMQQSAGAELEASGIDQDELWRHVVATAILADALASVDVSLKPVRPIAFGAGLLHDVGRLALATASPPHYQRVLRRVAVGTDVLEAERTEFNTDHTQLGLEIASAWGLPAELLPAIGAHHQPGAGLADAVYRGRQLVAALGIGDGVTPPSAASFSEATEDALAVMHVGGVAQVQARIDWFRGALPR
jgi:putative nucleotidyltransferase with HDIG domain